MLNYHRLEQRAHHHHAQFGIITGRKSAFSCTLEAVRKPYFNLSINSKTFIDNLLRKTTFEPEYLRIRSLIKNQLIFMTRASYVHIQVFVECPLKWKNNMIQLKAIKSYREKI